MSSLSRQVLRLTSMSVIVALVFSALMVAPAFADDGVPPAEEAAPVEEGETLRRERSPAS